MRWLWRDQNEPVRELLSGPAMGRHPLTSVAVPDPGPIPTFRLFLVLFAAPLLFAFSLSNSHGVAALSVPVPVIAAPAPAPYDLDQEEEYQANLMEGQNSRLGEEEVTRLKQRILEGLGLTRAPDASKVSQAWLQAVGYSTKFIHMLVLIRNHAAPWFCTSCGNAYCFSFCFVPFLTFPLKRIFIRCLGNPARVRENEEVCSDRQTLRLFRFNSFAKRGSP